MRIVGVVLVFSFVFVGLGCTSTEKIDFGRYEGFVVTPGVPDAKYTICGYFEINNYGANIFGFIPIGSVSVEEALNEIVASAKKAGADGLSFVRIRRWGPPFPWAFLLWYRGAKVSGYGFKFVKG
jgi:hypothetical protein